MTDARNTGTQQTPFSKDRRHKVGKFPSFSHLHLHGTNAFEQISLVHYRPSESRNTKSDQIRSTGATIDLTLFAITRALDAIIHSTWRRLRTSGKPTTGRLTSILSQHTDTLLFALSSGTIMWSWFYRSEALPKEYNTWIGSAAQVDARLIRALRQARAGTWMYGKDRGDQARFLQDMCRDYGWPVRWGDPEMTVPIPCEMVHMGAGSNCEWHAGVRFWSTFRWALGTNLPLQLLVKVASRRKVTVHVLTQAGRDAARSSAFLGAFVALMYYGICLSRTRVGPKVFGKETVTPQMWDSGLCVRAACILCGWSVLLETRKKRQELAMFVAPRALATQLPRDHDARYFWRGRLAFSISIAVLFTLAQEDPNLVRGVLGKVLGGVLRY